MGGMKGEQLGKGGGRVDLWGGCRHQEGVYAKGSEESIDIGGSSIRGVLGRKCSWSGVVAVVVVVEFAFVGSQGLIRLKGEVCPEVEVGGEVGEGRGEVAGVLLDGVDDVETTQIERRHHDSTGQGRRSPTSV